MLCIRVFEYQIMHHNNAPLTALAKPSSGPVLPTPAARTVGYGAPSPPTSPVTGGLPPPPQVPLGRRLRTAAGIAGVCEAAPPHATRWRCAFTTRGVQLRARPRAFPMRVVCAIAWPWFCMCLLCKYHNICMCIYPSGLPVIPTTNRYKPTTPSSLHSKHRHSVNYLSPTGWTWAAIKMRSTTFAKAHMTTRVAHVGDVLVHADYTETLIRWLW